MWFILYNKALRSFTYNGITIEDDDYLNFKHHGTFLQENGKDEESDSDSDNKAFLQELEKEIKRFNTFWRENNNKSNDSIWWNDGYFTDYDIEFYEA